MSETTKSRGAGPTSDRAIPEGGRECASHARLPDARLGRESSIEDQVRKCREDARRDGGFIPEANLFTDTDVPGATESRPGLDRLLATVLLTDTRTAILQGGQFLASQRTALSSKPVTYTH